MNMSEPTSPQERRKSPRYPAKIDLARKMNATRYIHSLYLVHPFRIMERFIHKRSQHWPHTKWNSVLHQDSDAQERWGVLDIIMNRASLEKWEKNRFLITSRHNLHPKRVSCHESFYFLRPILRPFAPSFY